MEERIRKFMDFKGITPSELADSIGVQRSNVTHVLHGRNNPSLPFIEKMLQFYPELNAEWFMRGVGNMVNAPTKAKTLFDQINEPVATTASAQTTTDQQKSQTEVPKSPVNTESEPKQIIVNEIQPTVEKKAIHNELQDQFFSAEKPIERMIVFFKDQTFKVYSPSR